MTILDTFLEEAGKAFNGESFDYPAYAAISTSSITSDVTDTSLTGEIGTRLTLTGTRTDNQLQWSSIRLSTDVVDTSSGDSLKAQALFADASSGTMFTEQAPFVLNHTTSYEIEFINNIIFRRPT